MASVFETIANSTVTVLASLSGAPTVSGASNIEVRKDDSMKGGDTLPLGIVTMGAPQQVQELSGAGTSTDLGDVLWSYPIVITIYRTCLADIETDVNLNPDYIQLAKRALNKNSLAGAATVYDTKIIESPEWEHVPFGKGHEVSRFGVLFYSAETRLGN